MSKYSKGWCWALIVGWLLTSPWNPQGWRIFGQYPTEQACKAAAAAYRPGVDGKWDHLECSALSGEENLPQGYLSRDLKGHRVAQLPPEQSK